MFNYRAKVRFEFKIQNSNLLCVYSIAKMCEKCKEEKVLKDISKNGYDRKWRERKLQNIELGARLEKLGYRNFSNVYQCSEVLRFLEQEDKSLKLHQAWFCKNRLCPICNWRRSMKYSAQLSEIIDVAIQKKPNSKFLFLTLTVKNCEGDELKETTSAMTKAFNRLIGYKKPKKNLLGYVRSMEVTYNEERKDYHPHLHILLMVKSSYFTGNGENYISQDEWSTFWKRAMKLDYEPVVDVRKIYAKKHKQKYVDAIKEVAKYPMKPIEIMGITEEEKLQITDDLMIGLRGKRQLGFGGIFKEIRKELQLDDVESGDLINIDDEQKESSLGKEIVAMWNWERKNYFIR